MIELEKLSIRQAKKVLRQAAKDQKAYLENLIKEFEREEVENGTKYSDLKSHSFWMNPRARPSSTLGFHICVKDIKPRTYDVLSIIESRKIPQGMRNPHEEWVKPIQGSERLIC